MLEVALTIWFVLAVISCIIVGISINAYDEHDVIDGLAFIILFFWKWFMIFGAILSASYIIKIGGML